MKVIFQTPLNYLLLLLITLASANSFAKNKANYIAPQKTSSLSENIKPNSTQQERPDSEFKKLLATTIAKAESSFVDSIDAEVWLFEQATRLAKVAPHIPADERFKILRLVHQEATQFELDPMLVLALINVESNFDQFAISSAGALGLMQVMPFWKLSIGHPDDNLNDIATNLRYGCAILSLYLKKEKFDSTLALARYNGSRGQVWYPMRVYKAMRKVWHP
ncbi:MAG: lytic transglycosylase domain-containing protein [Enterobacterales bacterium]|nr:lytic transglycosylase domain-containing protein [Enterobacterales bacterium]